MTDQQIQNSCIKYIELLKDYSCERIDDTVKNPSREQVLNHCKWMVDQIPTITALNKIEKAMRWIGFVQSILWCYGFYSINELKNDNR